MGRRLACTALAGLTATAALPALAQGVAPLRVVVWLYVVTSRATRLAKALPQTDSASSPRPRSLSMADVLLAKSAAVRSSAWAMPDATKTIAASA